MFEHFPSNTDIKDCVFYVHSSVYTYISCVLFTLYTHGRDQGIPLKLKARICVREKKVDVRFEHFKKCWSV